MYLLLQFCIFADTFSPPSSADTLFFLCQIYTVTLNYMDTHTHAQQRGERVNSRKLKQWIDRCGKRRWEAVNEAGSSYAEVMGMTSVKIIEGRIIMLCLRSWIYFEVYVCNKYYVYYDKQSCIYNKYYNSQQILIFHQISGTDQRFKISSFFHHRYEKVLAWSEKYLAPAC